MKSMILIAGLVGVVGCANQNLVLATSAHDQCMIYTPSPASQSPYWDCIRDTIAPQTNDPAIKVLVYEKAKLAEQYDAKKISWDDYNLEVAKLSLQAQQVDLARQQAADLRIQTINSF